MTNAFEVPKLTYTFSAGADLSDYQYHAVKFDANGLVVLASDNASMLGVLQDTPEKSGRPCRVMLEGITKAVAGESIDIGDDLEIDSDGHFITQSTGSIVAVALSDASEGELFAIHIRHAGS